MRQQRIHTIFKLAIFLLFIAIFSYFRLRPIYLQTVPYTFDQGRDFLKAQEIVRDKNFTLLGPRTGAEGVFHGAWWYYFLAVPYIVNSHPTTFYYFIAASGLVQALLFFAFLKKEFSDHIAFAFLGLVSVSGYFVKSSIFAINSVMTLPFILLLLYSTYMIFKTKKEIFAFLIMLSIGFILSAEFPFGAFLIPIVIIAMFVLKKWKLFLGTRKRIAYSFAGIIFALSPRILFELRNNFFQTKSLLKFTNSEGTFPNTYMGVFTERIRLFYEYYVSIFPNSSEMFANITALVVVVGMYLGFKKLNKVQKPFLKFIVILLVLLFLFSMINKNNFFWAYYYEGIQYIFLTLVLLGLFSLQKVQSKLATIILYLIIGSTLLFGGQKVLADMTQNKPIPVEGLRMHTKLVNEIYDSAGLDYFCLRIYTPPVLLHTYMYVMDYTARTSGGRYPRTKYLNNQCWYIIEKDDDSERREKWIFENIPEGAKMLESRDVAPNVDVELWEHKEE